VANCRMWLLAGNGPQRIVIMSSHLGWLSERSLGLACELKTAEELGDVMWQIP